jgi:TonB family protein
MVGLVTPSRFGRPKLHPSPRTLISRPTQSGKSSRLAGCILSFSLHVALLLLVLRLLLQPAHFSVERGRNSVEIDLSTEARPAPLVTAVSKAQPRITSSPSSVKDSSLTPLRDRSVTLPDADAIPLLKPSMRSVQIPRPRIKFESRFSSVEKTSSSSRGEIAAEPDEIQNELPTYPAESLAAREQGNVLLHVQVTATGAAAAVGIQTSSGYFRLDQAARRAVEHWKFHPAQLAGVDVASETTVLVHFKPR